MNLNQFGRSQDQYMRDNLMNANAPQANPVPQGVPAEIDKITTELDLLFEEIHAVRDCFGAVLKAEDSCSATPQPVQAPQVQSPVRLQLMTFVHRLTEYRLMLRDLRARSDL
jgi:hypothetical protein